MHKPIFKHFGGKFLSPQWITQHFPPNHVEYGYIEPYVKGGDLFLNKPNSISALGEAINDSCVGISRIYQALRDEPKVFVGRLKKTKYCQQTFNRTINRANEQFKDYMDHAINEFILRNMSRGGQKKSFKDADNWNLDGLLKISDRLQRVYIFNKPPLETLAAYDNKDVIAFVDPPLLAEGVKVGEYEMSTNDHIKLWEILNQFRGKVIITGIPSVLYKRLYHQDNGWKCIKKDVKSIWVNF